MKKFELTDDQRAALLKVWKAGCFSSYELNIKNKKRVLKEWLQLGIIKYVSVVQFKIDRVRLINLDETPIQTKLKFNIVTKGDK